MVRLVVLAMAITLLAGCGPKKREDLRSPCVGTEESPCGVKRDVNAWWQA